MKLRPDAATPVLHSLSSILNNDDAPSGSPLTPHFTLDAKRAMATDQSSSPPAQLPALRSLDLSATFAEKRTNAPSERPLVRGEASIKRSYGVVKSLASDNINGMSDKRAPAPRPPALRLEQRPVTHISHDIVHYDVDSRPPTRGKARPFNSDKSSPPASPLRRGDQDVEPKITAGDRQVSSPSGHSLLLDIESNSEEGNVDVEMQAVAPTTIICSDEDERLFHLDDGYGPSPPGSAMSSHFARPIHKARSDTLSSASVSTVGDSPPMAHAVPITVKGHSRSVSSASGGENALSMLLQVAELDLEREKTRKSRLHQVDVEEEAERYRRAQLYTQQQRELSEQHLRRLQIQRECERHHERERHQCEYFQVPRRSASKTVSAHDLPSYYDLSDSHVRHLVQSRARSVTYSSLNRAQPPQEDRERSLSMYETLPPHRRQTAQKLHSAAHQWHVRNHPYAFPPYDGARTFPRLVYDFPKRSEEDPNKLAELSSDRPFACPGCDRTFARRYDRNRHARKHTGEKPYQCANPECGEEFCRPDALQRHYRAHQECEAEKLGKNRVIKGPGDEPLEPLEV